MSIEKQPFVQNVNEKKKRKIEEEVVPGKKSQEKEEERVKVGGFNYSPENEKLARSQ